MHEMDFKNRKNYPITTAPFHYIDNGEIKYNASGIVINNDEELKEFLLIWHENHNDIYFYDFALIGRYEFIYTPDIASFFRRYNFLYNHKIPSYSTTFDELPAQWVQVIEIITSNLMQAKEHYLRKKQSGIK